MDPPSEKLPKAPMGGNPALWGAADHGDDDPFGPALKGPVALRLNVPKGEVVSRWLSRVPLSLSFPSA